jgi:hypothetical protein
MCYNVLRSILYTYFFVFNCIESCRQYQYNYYLRKIINTKFFNFIYIKSIYYFYDYENYF